MKSAERRRKGLGILPASPCQPGRAVTCDGDRELFPHMHSGRALTLMEYVRAEEVLAASSPWRARLMVGALTLASEAPRSRSAAETALAGELRNERLEW